MYIVLTTVIIKTKKRSMNVYTFVLKMCVILKQSDTGHKKQKKNPLKYRSEIYIQAATGSYLKF